jgi:hypothetical protein
MIDCRKMVTSFILNSINIYLHFINIFTNFQLNYLLKPIMMNLMTSKKDFNFIKRKMKFKQKTETTK